MKISRPIVVGGGTFFSILFWGRFFLTRYFCELFFCESDITCIISVVGAQQQHKGMFFFKRGVRGANFSNSAMGGGVRFFSRVFSRGGTFFFAYRFCRTPPPPPPPRHK